MLEVDVGKDKNSEYKYFSATRWAKYGVGIRGTDFFSSVEYLCQISFQIFVACCF